MNKKTNAATNSSFPPTVAEIRAQILPRISGGSDERSYVYTDACSERLFDIRTMDDGRLFLCEYIPNGRYSVWNGDKLVSLSDSEVVNAAKQSPNTFFQVLVQAGLDPKNAVLDCAGFSVNSRYQASLEECASAIHRALAENRYYRSFRPLTRGEKIAEARQKASSSRLYWKERAATIERFMEIETGLFKGCHDAIGRPLAAETKQAILAYLNAPSQESWLEIRNKCVVGFQTPWGAWNRIDPNSPRMGSKGFPSADQVRQAIRYAVEEGLEEAKRRYSEAAHPSGLMIVK